MKHPEPSLLCLSSLGRPIDSLLVREMTWFDRTSLYTPLVFTDPQLFLRSTFMVVQRRQLLSSFRRVRCAYYDRVTVKILHAIRKRSWLAVYKFFERENTFIPNPLLCPHVDSSFSFTLSRCNISSLLLSSHRRNAISDSANKMCVILVLRPFSYLRTSLTAIFTTRYGTTSCRYSTKKT